MLFEKLDIKLDELQFALLDYENLKHSYNDSLEYLTLSKKRELEDELNKKAQRLFNLFKDIENEYSSIQETKS